MKEIIQLENIHYSYSSKHKALEGINLSVRKGEILAIIGSNGSGKSTLFHVLGGLLFPNNGNYFFKQSAITERALQNDSVNRNFRSSIAYVFQNPDSQLFCPTVFDELMFAPLQLGLPIEIARERTHSVMKMLNIESLSDRPSYMLSGGEKKRVAIGSVLTMNPEVLLFDEPMSGLDPKSRAFLIELLFQLNEAGKTILIATHHLQLVDHLQSRVAVINEQHSIEKIGAADDILTDKDLLVRTNLIHENWHVHGTIRHKHVSTEIHHKHK
jgi:cobalt/nickel transport system ATP-binding protein